MKEKIESCKNLKCIKLKNNFFWILGILITIIILLICGIIYLKKEETVSMGDLISISSGLVSIVLAIIAILYAISESVKTKNDNEKNIIILNQVKTGLEKTEVILDEVKFMTNGVSMKLDDISIYYEGKSKADFDVEDNHEGYTEEDTENEFTEVIYKGEIFWGNLGGEDNKLLTGVRPLLVIQNNIANKLSNTVTIAPITARCLKSNLPTHIKIKAGTCGLKTEATIILEGIQTISKTSLKKKIGDIDNITMNKVNKGLAIQFEI